MRADGSQRVVLNSPIQKNLLFGDGSGGKPRNGACIFQGVWEGEIQLLTLKVRLMSPFPFAPFLRPLVRA